VYDKLKNRPKAKNGIAINILIGLLGFFVTHLSSLKSIVQALIVVVNSRSF